MIGIRINERARTPMGHRLYENPSFSTWFHDLCSKNRIPRDVVRGAWNMIRSLPRQHWFAMQEYTSAVACIRIASKWLYDGFFGEDLISLNSQTHASERINWIKQEMFVIRSLGWVLSRFFPSPPATTSARDKPTTRTSASPSVTGGQGGLRGSPRLKPRGEEPTSSEVTPNRNQEKQGEKNAGKRKKKNSTPPNLPQQGSEPHCLQFVDPTTLIPRWN